MPDDTCKIDVEPEAVDGPDAVPVASEPPPVTIADLMARIEADANLTAIQRRDWASACRLLCERWLQVPPQAVQTDLERIDRKLADLHPQRLGRNGKPIRPATFETIKTRIRAALRRYGGLSWRKQVVLPSLGALVPEWAALWQQLPAVACRHHGAGRADLSRVIRRLSAQGIGPEAVTAEHLEECGAAILADDPLTSVSRRAERVRDARRAWTWARRHVPAWPQVDWQRPEAKPVMALPLESFPEAFQQDVEQYRLHRGIRPDIPTTPGMRRLDRLRAKRAARQIGGHGPGLVPALHRKPLADCTLVTHLQVLRRAAGALVRAGILPVEAVTSVGQVATIDAAAAMVDEALNGATPEADSWATAIAALRSIAVRWRTDISRDEIEDFAEEIQHYCVNGSAGMLPSIERKLLAFSPEMLTRLFGWPDAVFQEVHCVSQGGRHRVPPPLARRAAAACAVELLATVCPRRRTLVGTHLDTSIIRHSDCTATLYYPADQTKSKTRSLAADLDRRQMRMLHMFERCCQPTLAHGGTSRWLFPGYNGGPMNPTSFANLVCTTIWDNLGIRINLHLFRHLLAMLLLAEDPRSNLALVDALLGHVPGSEATRRYVVFHTKWASDAVREIIGGKLLTAVKRARPRPQA